MTPEIFITSGINYLQHRFYGNRPLASIKPVSIVPSQFNGKDEANRAIAQLLLRDAPCMIARFGSVEMTAFANWIDRHDPRNFFAKACAIAKGEMGTFWWSEKNRRSMSTPAGFFPCTNEMLDRFGEQVARDCALMDIHASWYPGEYRLKQRYYPTARTCTISELSAFGASHPWTKAFAGKKVLVIHPFCDTIQKQFAHRQDLFDDPDFMPDCHLTTYKPVVSHCNEETSFDNWFDALEHMIDEIGKLDFEIALIGAGAYGMSLAAAVKRMGRKAIHLGGETQILFGIIGHRWEQMPSFKTLVKPTWCHPSPAETPAKSALCENRAYW